MPLTIHTAPVFQPEKEYCFRVLLGELLGLDYRVAWTEGEPNYRLHLPNGTALVVRDHFWGKAGIGLQPANIPSLIETAPNPFQSGEVLTAVFGKVRFTVENQQIDCDLDVFASAFFMLTRWEEHALPDRDVHGRFPAESSLAWRNGFLHRPVVNEWADLLRYLFARLGWEPPRPKRTFRLHLTCDVDHPRLWWSVSDRLRTLGGSFLKRKNASEALFWLKKYFFNKQDPYDTFHQIMDAAEQTGHPAHFNFLGERPPESDCWYPLEHPFVRSLIENISARGHVIGFHPSYEAFDQPDIFNRELESLRRITPQPVWTGRQHYLRFAVPSTWRVWEQAGMAWDSTMGYPEHPGFRCGICQDFPVFDIEQRKILNLREKPLIAMDVTLALYRGWSPEQAYQVLMQLRHQVEKHDGEFVLLWHNSSLGGWEWREWQAFLKFESLRV